MYASTQHNEAPEQTWKDLHKKQPKSHQEETQVLTQNNIEELLASIDKKSVEIHEKIVKSKWWKDCPSLISLLPSEPNADECYGFCNYGKDGPLHYKYEYNCEDWNKKIVHYYVVGLYKKEYIKKVGEEIANQETLAPIQYYVVGSDGRCFWPCGEDLYSKWNTGGSYYKPWDTITSNKGLKKYVDREFLSKK